MIGKNQSEKKPVASAEALEVLEERKKDGELGYEQKLAYDHIKKFAGVSAEEAKKIARELAAYGVSEYTAIKIVDIMPIDILQLKHILAKEKKTFEEDEVSKMMDIVKSHKAK